MRVFLPDGRIFRSFEPVAEQELISIRDYGLAARAQLEPGALAYFDGGAGDAVTLRDNVAAWRRWATSSRS